MSAQVIPIDMGFEIFTAMFKARVALGAIADVIAEKKATATGMPVT